MKSLTAMRLEGTLTRECMVSVCSQRQHHLCLKNDAVDAVMRPWPEFLGQVTTSCGDDSILFLNL
jgi:hypothetical protein